MATVPAGVAEPTTSTPGEGSIPFDAHFQVDLVVPVQRNVPACTLYLLRAEDAPHRAAGLWNDVGQFLQTRTTAHDGKRTTAELFESDLVLHDSHHDGTGCQRGIPEKRRVLCVLLLDSLAVVQQCGPTWYDAAPVPHQSAFCHTNAVSHAVWLLGQSVPPLTHERQAGSERAALASRVSPKREVFWYAPEIDGPLSTG